MKVRWTNDSIRFRITPSELDALLRNEMVTEALHLPGGAVWEVQLRSAVGGPSRLTSDANAAVILLGPDDRVRLAAEDSEGVYFGEDSGGHGIRFYVEKDFPCAHPRAIEAQEPVTETFAPPADFVHRKDVAT